MRVLVVDNMRPEATAPQRGSFVRDQVSALRRAGAAVEHLSFPPGKGSYGRTTRNLRAILRRSSFDVVHAHYGLTGWCALLAGAHPLVVTFHGTDVRHSVVGPLSSRLARRIDLVAGASRALFASEAGRPGLPRSSGAIAVLSCGVDLERFRPRPRIDARNRLGLDPEGRYLLFPADPERAVKRHDRAAQVARLGRARLLTAGRIPPEEMPDWINAASAVLITSENEGFGLVAAEALACRVPVLSTPVGVARTLLDGVAGCLCAKFDPGTWSDVARKHLDDAHARVDGRARAAAFSADRMAERALAAYEAVLAGETSR